MKKIIFLATIICYTSIAAFAQHDQRNHQNKTNISNTDTTTKASVTDGSSSQQLSQMLSSYYNIKNALVTGDAASAASNADQFLRKANSIDYKVISEGNVTILSKDAGKISSTKDLNKQRQYFADLSSNMATVAKSLKLSS